MNHLIKKIDSMKNLIIIPVLWISCSTMSAQKSKQYQPDLQTKTQQSQNKEILHHFIQFGIMSRNHEEFKKKYNIEVLYQNCVITKTMSAKTQKNNRSVARILTEKYGNSWKTDLGFIPYGL